MTVPGDSRVQELATCGYSLNVAIVGATVLVGAVGVDTEAALEQVAEKTHVTECGRMAQNAARSALLQVLHDLILGHARLYGDVAQVLAEITDPVEPAQFEEHATVDVRHARTVTPILALADRIESDVVLRGYAEAGG